MSRLVVTRTINNNSHPVVFKRNDRQNAFKMQSIENVLGEGDYLVLGFSK